MIVLQCMVGVHDLEKLASDAMHENRIRICTSIRILRLEIQAERLTAEVMIVDA